MNSESSGSNSLRADMKKVLCERPRRGGIYSYHDFRQRQNHGDPEDLPSHQGMRRPYGWETKEFDDLIGPLRGYLHHSVGRPWNDVWSEVCQQTPSGNTVDEHLRGHVMREVDTYTFVEDGEVYCYGRYGSGARKVDGLYVDPRDGLLYVTPEKSFPWKREKRITIDGLHYCKGDDGVLYPLGWFRQTKARFPLKMIGDQKAMLIDGIWYWIDMAETPPSRLVEYIRDGVVERRRVYSARQDFVTGEFVNEGRYHADKRQMASRDLRRHGLRNTR